MSERNLDTEECPLCGEWLGATGLWQKALDEIAALEAKLDECHQQMVCDGDSMYALKAKVERLERALAVEKGWVKQYREAYMKSAAEEVEP